MKTIDEYVEELNSKGLKIVQISRGVKIFDTDEICDRVAFFDEQGIEKAIIVK